MSIKKWILIGVAVILLPILIFVVVCLARINTRVWDYPYSAELPKPGLGVDFKYYDLFGNLYIRWCNLLDNAQTAMWKAPEGVTKQTLSVPARDGYTIGGYVIVPEGREDDTLPTMLYCHGGAFFLTMMTCQLDMASVYATELQCRVILPQYRISLDAPYPTPVNDCYDTLKSIAADPKTDLDRVLIYGDSAGGNLAASVTQMCCDEGLLQPAGQMLIYPVTDTEQTYPDLVEYQYATWPREANIRMWKTYLDGRTPTPGDYAVPMLHDPLGNLPKAYVEVAELDILCDQGEAYAEKMRQSGIDVTLQKIAGAYHGYDGDVNNAFVQNVLQTRVAWLKSALSDEVNP